jgi:hypothetical protein
MYASGLTPRAGERVAPGAGAKLPTDTRTMKLKVLLGLLAWLVAISLLHIQFNVGWGTLADELGVSLGRQRKSLLVGFLPVT